MEHRSDGRYDRRTETPTETFNFSSRFEIGSLTVSPVHLRIEQLRPIIAAHRHSNVSYEIHYTHLGHGTVTIGEQTYDIRPGMVYITGPGIVHMQTSDDIDPIIEYCLYINCRCGTRQPNDPMLLFTDTHFWLGMDDGTIRKLLVRMIEENRQPQCDADEMSETLLRLIILHLTRFYRRGQVAQTHAVPLLTRDSFMPILEDAFFYRYRTLSLRELAGLLNLSVRQTQRLLLSHFGKTFSQKLSEARMAAASQFLDNTRLSITEIAERLGFSSIEHFSSSFRRNMGCSPSEYRKGSAARRAKEGEANR